LARDIKKKLNANICSFGQIALRLSQTTLWNAEVVVWPLTTMSS